MKTKIPIDKSFKIRLLKAMQTGYFDLTQFPEILENGRIPMTKEEIKQISDELEAKY